jgi:hypothetical protein
LADKNFDETTVNRTRTLLADFDGENFPDYDSARQRAWSYFMVTQEQQWTKGLRDRNAKELYRTRLTEFSEKLKGGLLLTLPSDRKRPYDQQLAEESRALSNYDPVLFRQSLQALDKKDSK